MKSIVILASGRGSNALRIIEHFEQMPEIQVSAIISDRKESGVLSLAKEKAIAAHYVPVGAIKEGKLLAALNELKPDLIVLAGFLRKIPQEVITAYPEAILNIHPALLPKHGGQGMYGMHVHEAVIAQGDTESGITIHYVNAEYDKGRHIAQFYCPVRADDNPKILAERVLNLEHKYLPLVIHAILSL